MHSGAKVLLLLLMTAVAAGCGAKAGENPVELAPVDSGAGTLASARRFLEGRWALQSFEVFPPGKPPIVLKGSGVLVYDSASNLNMEIRADEASADVLRAAGIDIRDGVISTSGRTAIDLQNRTLTYVIQGQAPLIQGPLGIRHPRHWVVEGDTLTLTTKNEKGEPLSIGRWKKSS